MAQSEQGLENSAQTLQNLKDAVNQAQQHFNQASSSTTVTESSLLLFNSPSNSIPVSEDQSHLINRAREYLVTLNAEIAKKPLHDSARSFRYLAAKRADGHGWCSDQLTWTEFFLFPFSCFPCCIGPKQYLKNRQEFDPLENLKISLENALKPYPESTPSSRPSPT